MSALATVALATWAPQVLPDLWASLRDHVVAAATAIGSGDSASGRAEAARALLLLTPVLGMALLGVVFAIWAGRPPKVTTLTDNRAPAPEASAAEKATPRSGTAEVAAPAAGRSTISIGGLTSFLAGAVPVLVLGALAVAGLDQRVATVGEGRLAAGAALYPAPVPGGLSWPDTLVVPQIAAIDILLRSAPGPADVVDRARAALLVAGVLGCLLLWTAARRILPAPSAALAMALCGLPALALGLYGTVDAGVLGALWLTAAAALAGRSRGATLLAVGATVIAGLTVPLAAVAPLVLLGHGLLDGSFGVGLSRAEPLAVGLIGAAGVIALGVTSRWPPDVVAWVGSGHGAVPGPVLAGVFAAGVVVTALAWWLTPSLRPLSTAAGAVLACAAVPGPHVTTALLLALPVLAALAAAVIDERLGRRWRKPGS
jgi:hypothetical protein